jgi:hypothetical protein
MVVNGRVSTNSYDANNNVFNHKDDIGIKDK